MAGNKSQATIDLPTKAWINVNKNKALIRKLMQKNSELTDSQKSWIEKNLWEEIFDVVNSPIEYIASKVWWKLPRWGSTNATRPNPFMWTIYPMSHWQWSAPDPDSWQINNAFNADSRLPNWSEISNWRYANWEPFARAVRKRDAYWNVYTVYDDYIVPEAWLAKIVGAPFVLSRPWLATDAIWTLYASLRNWYNAIADYYNKWSSKWKSDEQYQKTLDALRDSLKEAEEAKQRIDEYDKSYKEYMKNTRQNPSYSPIPADESMSYSTIESRPYTFEDYIKDRNDTDILDYIEENIKDIPNVWTKVDDEWKTDWTTKLWKVTESQIKNALWYL